MREASFTISIAIAGLLIATSSAAQPALNLRMRPEIGEAYGRLGKAIATHDIEAVKTVWSADLVVNAPNNTVLDRNGVISALQSELLDYKGSKKNISNIAVHPGVVIVMGQDTMTPLKGPGAGRRVVRPFTDIWMKQGPAWMLIARQATIAASD